MSLDTERSLAAGGVWESLSSAMKRVLRHLRRLGTYCAVLFNKVSRLPPWSYLSASLHRRILATNLIGLFIVVVGILYLGQHHEWLVDSKREALTVQGEMLAAAISGDARVKGRQIRIKPNQIKQKKNKAPLRDDGFTSLQLSMRPERVTPLLHKLIQPARTRARIYARDGTLIVDSARLLTRGRLAKGDPETTTANQVKTKNFWTRLKSWLIDKELPVYKEIGTGNGKSYPEVKMALEGTTTAMLLLNEDGDQIVSVTVPIRQRKNVLGALLLSTRPGEIDKILEEEQALILTLAGIALLASIVTSLMLARTVAGPMRRLSDVAEQVSRNEAGPKDLPKFAGRIDEVGQMADAFHSMTAALSRRVEASERFAADVAHELKNPLTAARSTAESLAFAKSEEQREDLVQQIQNELRRLNRLITDVSNASRLDAELARQQMKPIDATAIAKTVSQIFKEILLEDTRKVRLLLEPAPFEGAYMVSGDEGRIVQVLTNLVDNAISFSPEGSVVTLRTRHAGQSVHYIVEDRGPGILESHLESIFDRFYSDRPATEAVRGKNSGLGLSISREIVTAHGGRIWAENIFLDGKTKPAEPKGARFVVSIPALHARQRTGLTSGRRA